MSLNDFEAEFSELVDVFNRMIGNKGNKIEAIDFIRSKFVVDGAEDLCCKGFNISIEINLHDSQFDNLFEGRMVVDL